MDLLVSACLAGTPCRYDGGHCRVAAIADLVRRGRALAVCPEILGGLAVPRDACEIRKAPDGSLRVVSAAGRDLSASYTAGAGRTLRQAEKHSITRAVLKTRSPSCGFGAVYDGSFSGRLVPGNGITAALLHAHGIRIYTEEDLPQDLGR
jgi:uncharacterized protein YbbK (DUF523 family)